MILFRSVKVYAVSTDLARVPSGSSILFLFQQVQYLLVPRLCTVVDALALLLTISYGILDTYSCLKGWTDVLSFFSSSFNFLTHLTIDPIIDEN